MADRHQAAAVDGFGAGDLLAGFLLELLRLKGWELHLTAAFAGRGVQVVATKPGRDEISVVRHSASVALLDLYVQACS